MLSEATRAGHVRVAKATRSDGERTDADSKRRDSFKLSLLLVHHSQPILNHLNSWIGWDFLFWHRQGILCRERLLYGRKERCRLSRRKAIQKAPQGLRVGSHSLSTTLLRGSRQAGSPKNEFIEFFGVVAPWNKLPTSKSNFHFYHNLIAIVI